ncbi:MAG: hypothetical protein AAFR33_01090 [Pseudomonadota bacterium]
MGRLLPTLALLALAACGQAGIDTDPPAEADYASPKIMHGCVIAEAENLTILREDATEIIEYGASEAFIFTTRDDYTINVVAENGTEGFVEIEIGAPATLLFPDTYQDAPLSVSIDTGVERTRVKAEAGGNVECEPLSVR